MKNRPRLQEFSYIGEHAYSITVCTHEKEHVFKNTDNVNLVVEALKLSANDQDFIIYAYCFMPDHVHLLVKGKDETSDLEKFVKIFKQRSGFEYSKRYKSKLWQPSYYDHVLRKEDDIKVVALYIFNNPIRKGIVSDLSDYPFLGSFVFDVKEIGQV